MAKKLDKMTKEELELLSYNDIADLILKEKPQLSTLDIFTKIVEKLELPQKTIDNKIGDFYTALTKDQRFIMLEDGTWDMTSKYKSKNLSIEDDIEDYDESEEYDDLQEDLMDEDDLEDDYSDNDENNDTSEVTEEYKNLVIVDEEELEQN